MKLVLASDIHGAADACAALLRIVEEERPDHLILLGDLLYHGPRNDLPYDYNPREVARMLNRMADRIIAVRGNCDAEVDQMVLSFPCMSDYALLTDGPTEMFLTHGHVWGPGLHNSIDHLPNLPNGSWLVYGHTHIKVNERLKGHAINLFNPGSLGIPKDGIRSCGVYDNGVWSYREIDS